MCRNGDAGRAGIRCRSRRPRPRRIRRGQPVSIDRNEQETDRRRSPLWGRGRAGAVHVPIRRRAELLLHRTQGLRELPHHERPVRLLVTRDRTTATASCVDCHLPHDFVGKYLAKADNGYHHSKGFTLQDFHEPILIKAEERRTSCRPTACAATGTSSTTSLRRRAPPKCALCSLPPRRRTWGAGLTPGP